MSTDEKDGKKGRGTQSFDGIKNLMPSSAAPKKTASPPKVAKNSRVQYSAREPMVFYQGPLASGKKAEVKPAKKKPKGG